MNKTDLFKLFHNIGLVPVVKIDDAAKAVPLAKAMIKGGLPVAEITFRTAAAEQAIKNISTECPEMLVGAGTVINPELAKKAVSAGATFVVSPGLNEETVKWCNENNVPVVPGVCTPSDVEKGLSLGLDVLKFFPAEASGGVNMLKNLAGPFPQVKFMTTGGISTKNLKEYATCPNVLAIGGSWMVSPDLIESENYDEITRLCKEAVTALQGFEFAHIGLNNENQAEADKAIDMLSVFGFEVKRGASSAFVSSSIEVLPKMFYGKLGHIGFRCNDIERVLYYLSSKGFSVKEESVQKDAKGKIKVAYINEEIAGFAIHFIK